MSERFPALSRLAVALSGDVWVLSFSRPGADGQEWLVFDADGMLRRHVDLPPPSRYFPRAFGDSWVAGSERDELGVEYVAVYDLVSAPP